jgi:hypothetical protein
MTRSRADSRRWRRTVAHSGRPMRGRGMLVLSVKQLVVSDGGHSVRADEDPSSARMMNCFDRADTADCFSAHLAFVTL